MTPDTIYIPSEKIISRDIMGKMIIVPIESGIADLDDAMFSFNETGTIAWKCIEQKKTVKQICSAIAQEYESDMDRIEKGVIELIDTLLEKGIIVERKS